MITISQANNTSTVFSVCNLQHFDERFGDVVEDPYRCYCLMASIYASSQRVCDIINFLDAFFSMLSLHLYFGLNQMIFSLI